MTRPAPLRQRRPATCFVCARVCVAGARGGGVAAAWAPQLRRWCWPGAGRSGAPSPTPRVPPLAVRRPAPWPPLPPARPRPGFRAVTRAAAAAAAAAAAEAAKADALTPGLPGRNRGTESGPGNRGCSVSDSEQRTPRWRREDSGLVPAAACGACRPAGGEMPPPPWSGGAGPVVQPSRRSPPSPGARPGGAPSLSASGSSPRRRLPATPVTGSRVRRAAEASPGTRCPFESRTGEDTGPHPDRRPRTRAPGNPPPPPLAELSGCPADPGSSPPGPGWAAPAKDLTCAGCRLPPPSA